MAELVAGCPMTERRSFLVIGAMKSGTTTMWEDLRAHPDLAVTQKEAGLLHRCPGDDDRLRRLLDRELSTLRDRRWFAEVCTTYAMRPHLPDVSVRARRVLGPDLQVVYLVRHPVDRIVSHHRHDVANGTIRVGIDEAVRRDDRLLDYTRYATQLRPWLDAVGRDAVHVVPFESYVADRQTVLSRLWQLLDVSPLAVVDEVVHNRSADKHVTTGPWRHAVASAPYRRVIRPLLSERFRRRAAARVLPAAPPAPKAPSQETEALIRRELSTEIEVLRDHVAERLWPDLC